MGQDNFARRVHFLRIAIALILMVAASRLFYLQVIKHDHFKLLASEEQLRKFEVLPRRGTIYLNDRSQSVPIVMNRDLKKVFADPRYIQDIDKTAQTLSDILNIEAREIAEKLKDSTYYAVIANAIEPELAEKVQEHEIAGIGIQDAPVRVYPEGALAAHVLGFVNQDGIGQYGIEEALNASLQGERGLLRATTDTRGIPIATSDNFQIPPTEGADVVLTIERNIQAKVEAVLKEGRSKYSAPAASAIVMDPHTGAILAMANFPNFEPSNYTAVTDYNLFANTAAGGLYEPGSVIKVFTMAAGLETGALTPQTTYQNTGEVKVADRVIQNAAGIPNGTFNMHQVIVKSINTGVVFVLQAMGGGEINISGKTKLHSFLTERFGFGAATGVDLPIEPAGTIREPSGSDVDYANMTFGQGMSATMLQVATAYSAIANGGNLLQPYLVHSVISPQGDVTLTQTKIRKENILSPKTIRELKDMMEGVVIDSGDAAIAGYKFGGKSGTAQIPNPAGGYFENRDIGSFVGLAPIDNPKYVVMVRIDEPKIGTFASAAARPMAAEIMRWLFNYGGIPPQ